VIDWLFSSIRRLLRRKGNSHAMNRIKAARFGIFDSTWYRAVNQDVDFSETDPFEYHSVHGWLQGRDPSPCFNARVHAETFLDFRMENEDPVADAISRIEKRTLTKRELKKIVRQTNPSSSHLMPLRDGISVSGYLRSEIGLGQAARNIVKAIDAAAIPVSLHDFPLKDRHADSEYSARIQQLRDRRVNLLVLPVTELPLRRREHRQGAHSILYPFWELPVIPAAFRDEIKRYDEVWAPSNYLAEMFSQLGIRSTLVRQPLQFPELTNREVTGGGGLNILSHLDFDSYVARKNVKAPIIAFKEAFPGQDDVTLTIKVRGHNDCGMRRWLSDHSSMDRRIRIIDSTLSRVEVDRLVMGCDVFISLHRSEGFGFGAAEALAAGKAVVATNYSGTTDFITHETGYPVDYDLIPVREGEYPYWENQVWAEPRISSAVEALRTIHADQKLARDKGNRGRKLMECLYSPKAVGERISRLLMERGLL